MRVVDLPLGATEDKVMGSLDVEKAITLNVEALEPGGSLNLSDWFMKCLRR